MRPAGGGLGAASLHRRAASLLLFRVVLVPAVSAVVVTNSSTLLRGPLGRAVHELAVLHREGPEGGGETPTHQDMHKLDVGSSADDGNEVMEDTFGKEWKTYPEAVSDGSKCVQWGLGATDDADQGLWDCMSVLLRNAMLSALGVKWDGSPVEGATNSTPWRRVVPEKLCKLIMKKFPNREVGECYTRTWGVDKFAELMQVWREMAPVAPETPDFKGERLKIAESFRKGPLVSMVTGAGKSGSSFSATPDGVYKVKMKLKSNCFMDEPRNLMRLIEGEPGKSMVEHYRANPKSILNRIYGLFHLGIGPTTTYAIVMGDAYYGINRKVKDRGDLVTRRYDLKGASRNQNEKLVTGFSLINGDFNVYEQGKVNLQPGQCSDLHKVLEADTDFLQGHDIIDYSLMMLTVRPTKDTASPDDVLPICPDKYQTPFCQKGQKHLYTFALADYLINFSIKKRLESLLRGGKFRDYGHKIVKYGRDICHGPKHAQND